MTAGLTDRVNALDWAAVCAELEAMGSAQTREPLLGPDECRAISVRYDEPDLFRSTIDMERYRFGAGEYRYFANPLPEDVAELRAAFWPHLLPVARDWAARLNRSAPWPDDFDAWLSMCHAAGQTKPTPILLRYGPGDWNALHRDLATVLGQGQALIFTTRDRPVASARGWSAAPMRHGVSVIRSGRRHTLGLVLHDAQ